MQPAMAYAMHHLLPWNVHGEVHKVAQDLVGLKAGQKLLLSTLTHINIFTRCDVNQE